MGILLPDSRARRRGVCGHVRLRRPDPGRAAACKRRHDHEHDAPAGRGAGLALGTPDAGQVHVGRRAARLPGHRLQRPVGIPAGLQRRRLEEGRDQGREHRQPAPTGLAAEEGKTGTIIWTMRSPYVFVGGRSRGGRQRGRSLRFRPTARNGRTSRAATSTSSFRLEDRNRITSTNSVANSPAAPG